MGLGSGFVLVVEAHGAVGTEVINVSRLGRIKAFDTVHPTTGHHLPSPVENHIDFFCPSLMMRKIRVSRRIVHAEKTGHHVRFIYRTALSTPRTHQSLVHDRCELALHALLT